MKQKRLSLFKKLLIIVVSFNLAFGGPVAVLAASAPEPPSPPSAPSRPPSPPSAPEAPEAPEPPSPPGEEEEVDEEKGDEQTEEPVEEVNQATNTDTGSDSDNQAEVEEETSLETENENQGEVVNQVNSQAVTGANTASYNTGDGQIETGEASQSLQVSTNLNSNQTLYSENNGASVNQAGNGSTGADSDNLSLAEKKLKEAVGNKNLGELTNKIMVNSISGQNLSSYNTGSGSVKTGDAQANLALLSAVNTNTTGEGGMKTFNIYDQHQGDLVFTMDDFKDGMQFNTGNPDNAYQQAEKAVAENSATGSDSQNQSETATEKVKEVDNDNQAKLVNDIEINAISGENNTVKNTGQGDIQTGDAQAVGTLVNFLNTNLMVEEWMIGVVNIFGELVGDIVLPKNEAGSGEGDGSRSNGGGAVESANHLTGPDSDNASQADQESKKIFSNYNQAEVINNIETAAVTGANTASYNTGPGQVVDGDAQVNTKQVNLANNNAVAEEETFWLVLVNEMGEWLGKIVGQESGETIASNLTVEEGLPEFSEADEEQLVEAKNLATGSDSDNQAEVEDKENLAVENKNQAVIENNVKVVADSGKNSGSYNTLGGGINAGDAQAGLSLVNFVNNNIVGNKLAILVVDVLGKWVGDVVPPDQEKAGENQSSNQPVGGPVVPEGVVVEEKGETADKGEEDGGQAVYHDDGFSDTYNQMPQGPSNSLADQSSWSSSFSSQSFNYGSHPQMVASPVNYPRGLFASPVFAQETTASGAMTADPVNEDWFYVLLPSFFGILIAKSKKMRTFLASLLY